MESSTGRSAVCRTTGRERIDSIDTEQEQRWTAAELLLGWADWLVNGPESSVGYQSRLRSWSVVWFVAASAVWRFCSFWPCARILTCPSEPARRHIRFRETRREKRGKIAKSLAPVMFRGELIGTSSSPCCVARLASRRTCTTHNGHDTDMASRAHHLSTCLEKSSRLHVKGFLAFLTHSCTHTV